MVVAGTNSFYATLAQSLALSGSETTVYLSRITTLTGETISTADFATFGRGVLTIEPTSPDNMEFISFTAIDSVNIAATGATRGLSAKNDSVIAANKKYHPVGSRVIISFGVHQILDILAYINAVLVGTIGNASTTLAGVTKLSSAPVSATNPIAVGDNDPRIAPNSYGVDAGANDSYAITLSSAPASYVAGQVYSFKANTVNTGACTLNVNGLGAKAIKINKDYDPVNGTIKSGQVATVIYDGTNFQLVSVSGKPQISIDSSEVYAATASGSDAYSVTLNPAPTAYSTGMLIWVKADVANTGGATINVNGLGIKTITRPDGTALQTGDIVVSHIFGLVYDGTNFQLIASANQKTPTNVQTFTTAGANTWTKTSGAVRVLVQAWGGGGGGGRGNSGAGGGGGEYKEFWFDASSLGATETVTIGAGGAARGTDGNGNGGLDTTFGSWLTAFGGSGGGGGGANQAGGNGGFPNTTISSNIDGFWGAGVSAGIGQSGIYSGAGGGVNNGTGNASAAGFSVYGGAGGGGGGSSTTTNGRTSIYGGAGGNGSNGSSNGTAGAQPGGGGGGTSGSGTSGKGGDGKCIVTTFF